MMHLTVHVILVLIFISGNAESHLAIGSPKFGAEWNQHKEVIDMDSLMDTHYPQRLINHPINEPYRDLSAMKSQSQIKPKPVSKDFESILLPESGTGERIFGNPKEAKLPSSTENMETSSPEESEDINTIPPILRRLFLDHGSNVKKRGFLSSVNLLHKSRKAQKTLGKPSATWDGQLNSSSFGISNALTPKIAPPLPHSLKDSKGPHHTPSYKRSAGMEAGSRYQPLIETKQCKQVRKSRKAEEPEKRKWEEWHSIGNPSIVQKREANSRRIRISNIWNKSKKEINHEEGVKIVLPVLLSDMKESKELKRPMMMLASNNARIQSPVSRSTGLESLALKNFRVKGENGKEFSFSASVSDVQQLFALLSKPDSLLMLEKVLPDRGKNDKSGKISAPGRGNKGSALEGMIPKLVEKEFLADCTTSTPGPRMKEIETEVLENVFQVDIPCCKATTKSCTTPTARITCEYVAMTSPPDDDDD